MRSSTYKYLYIYKEIERERRDKVKIGTWEIGTLTDKSSKSEMMLKKIKIKM